MRFTAAAAALFVAALAHDAAAQCDDKQLFKITPSPWNVNGLSSAYDGDVAVIGQPGGVVEVFEVVGGSLTGSWTLTGDGNVFSSHFGTAVAISGDRIVVSAPFEKVAGNSDVGAVYVFERVGNAWVKRPKLFPPTNAAQQAYGAALDLDGDRICMSRRSATESVVDVRDFDGVNWPILATLNAPGTDLDDGFGYHLALDGDRVIAASREPSFGGIEGAVRVFEPRDGTWQETAKLIPGGAISAYLGGAIDLHGDRIIASGSATPLFGAAVPTVFVFDRFGSFWVQTAMVTSVDGQFGFAVALGDDMFCATSPTSVASGGAGAASIFRLESGQWRERMRLLANDPQVCRNLGENASLSGDRVLLSARGSLDAPNGSPGGAAYIMSTVPNPAPEYGTACPGSGGFLPTLALKQTFDGCFAAGNGVSFDVAHALGGSTCLLLLGLSTAASPVAGGCTLLVTPEPANQAFPLFGSGAGNGAVSFSATIPSDFPSVSVFLQAFVIDPGAFAGYCATNGLRLTVK